MSHFISLKCAIEIKLFSLLLNYIFLTGFTNTKLCNLVSAPLIWIYTHPHEQNKSGTIWLKKWKIIDTPDLLTAAQKSWRCFKLKIKSPIPFPIKKYKNIEKVCKTSGLNETNIVDWVKLVLLFIISKYTHG